MNVKPILFLDGKNKPSVTLLFAYIGFICALICTFYLSYKDPLAGSVSSLVLFFGSLLIYRLRRLDSFKIDVDDKSFEVNNAKSN